MRTAALSNVTLDDLRAELASRTIHVRQCWGCARKFGPRNRIVDGKLLVDPKMERISTSEFLCDDPECPANVIAHGRTRRD